MTESESSMAERSKDQSVQPKRFKRWLVTISLVGLVLWNIVLVFLNRSADANASHAQQQSVEAKSTIFRAESEKESSKSEFNRLARKVRRIRALTAPTRTAKDFVVRSGDQIVGQVVRTGTRSIRVLMYLPEPRDKSTPIELCIGINELWGSEFSKRKSTVRDEDPSRWKNVLINQVAPGVHQIDIEVVTGDSSQVKIAIDGDVAGSHPLPKVSRNVSASYGSYFHMNYPNSYYDWSALPRDELLVNEVLDHLFSFSKIDDGTRGGAAIRCWASYRQNVCISAIHLKMKYANMAVRITGSTLLRRDRLNELFLPYDQSGVFVFKDNWSDTLTN